MSKSMKLTKICGDLPELHVVRCGKDSWLLFGGDGQGGLAVSAMVAPGSLSGATDTRRCWRRFLKDNDVVPEYWSVKAMVQIFRKWLRRQTKGFYD